MTTLLVMTAGQTDVQLADGAVRHEFDTCTCGTLHDEIEKRSWRVVDSPASKAMKRVRLLPPGELALCTPKLDAVLRKVLPDAALVLETRRDAHAAPGDPRFAGAVLQARLKNMGVDVVHRQAYLQGAERLEDRDEPRDAVVRREVVQRLEQAVRDTIEAVRPSRIVVAATGGFPVVTNLVEEIVRLYAAVPVDAFEVPDGTKSNPPAVDRAVARTAVPEPLASFQARRRALELVNKGNLLGAWAVTEPLHADAVERRWTQVIEWLGYFASSRPMPKGCDLAVLGHERKGVRAALRVELALRAGDIPRAVHGTVAFFEAALWDKLGETTLRHKEKRQFAFNTKPPPSLVREDDCTQLATLSKTKRDENKRRPFVFKESADGKDWYWIDDSEICAVQIAKHFLRLDGLTALAQTVGKPVRELRNDVAHDEPTPDLMSAARSRLQAAALWSTTDTVTFLSQPLVQAVLKELGEAKPDTLLVDLLAEVRRRLLTPGAGDAA